MRFFTRAQHLDALRQVPSFRDLNARELGTLSRLSTEVQVPAGKVLTRRGDRGKEFMLILEGTARVEVGSRRAVRLGPGDFFGEMSLLDGEPRSAHVVAETPMRLLVLSHRDFWGLLAEVPTMTRKIMIALSRRLRTLEAEGG